MIDSIAGAVPRRVAVVAFDSQPSLVQDFTADPDATAASHAVDQFFAFAAGRPLSRALLSEWRSSMECLAASTINVRLSAVRRLVQEALHAGMLDAEEAAKLTNVPNIRERAQGSGLSERSPEWGDAALEASSMGLTAQMPFPIRGIAAT